MRCPDLSLYLFEGCPYCEDVRDALRALEVEVEERDIHRVPSDRDALVAARGRATVPVLRIASADGDDEWVGESRDIVRYLHRRFAPGTPPPARSLRRWVQPAMWGLLLAGGVSPEPWQSGLWTAACLLAGTRSFWMARRSGAFHHWAIGSVFFFGALSIALAALGVADLPWWWAALGVTVLLAARSLWAQLRRRAT